MASVRSIFLVKASHMTKSASRGREQFLTEELQCATIREEEAMLANYQLYHCFSYTIAPCPLSFMFHFDPTCKAGSLCLEQRNILDLANPCSFCTVTAMAQKTFYLLFSCCFFLGDHYILLFLGCLISFRVEVNMYNQYALPDLMPSTKTCLAEILPHKSPRMLPGSFLPWGICIRSSSAYAWPCASFFFFFLFL